MFQNRPALFITATVVIGSPVAPSSRVPGTRRYLAWAVNACKWVHAMLEESVQPLPPTSSHAAAVVLDGMTWLPAQTSMKTGDVSLARESH